MLSDRCLSWPVLSVTLVYCNQTVGRIKMKLGMQVERQLKSRFINGLTYLPLPRYGDILIFQDGGRRHLGFLECQIFSGRWLQRGSNCVTVPNLAIFGRPFVKRFTLCYRSIVLSVCLFCLVCLSVCDVGVLWPNRWTDQDETRLTGRPRTWPHCVRWGPSSPPLNPPIFGPYLLRPNGCMDQDVSWYRGRPRPRRLC